MPFLVFATDISETTSITMSATVHSNSPAVNFIGGSGGFILKGGVLIFRGYAYPNALITLTKNGQVVSNVFADKNAFFEISLTQPDLGNYDFVLGAKEASSGDLSIFYKFNVAIERGSNILISGIVFPPTINSNKSEITQGSVIKFFGRTIPNSKITLKIEPYQKYYTITADSLGNWTFYYDTSIVPKGIYQAKIKINFNNLLSEYSEPILFRVGEITLPSLPSTEEKNAPPPVIEVPLYLEVPIVQTPEQVPQEQVLSNNGLRVKYSILYFLLLILIPILLFFLRKMEKEK